MASTPIVAGALQVDASRMNARFGFVIAAMAVGGQGCAPIPEAALTTALEPAPNSLTPIDVRALEREVTLVRKLPLDHEIAVQALSDQEFHGRLNAQARLGRTATNARNAFWQTLGAGVLDRSPGESERRVLEEQVVGFYDPRAKSLFVRGSAGSSGQIVPRYPGTRTVLAHEIVHALQDQHFDLKYGQGLNEDEALAYLALVEGDAVLTSNGVRANESASFDSRLSRFPERDTASLLDLVEHGGVATAELRRAPPILRRRLLFPYVEGTSFALDIYRSGGFELLNKAFAQLPRSTEQVLHYEKYLAGEEPIPVDWPRPPPGWQEIAAGTMGELLIGVTLSQCMPSQDAELAASGWGGDAWIIVTDSEHRTAMLWSTVWDDEASAIRFERAGAARASCARTAPLFAEVGRDVLALRNANRVAYTQGLPEPMREYMTRGLLSLPFDPPSARPPFGGAK
jgi:hypothetical protein